MDKKHNVATFRTAAGYRKFDLYCQELKVEYDTSLRKPQIEKQQTPSSVEVKHLQSKKRKVNDYHKFVSMGGINRIDEGWNRINGRRNMSSQSEELLHYHHKLGHTGFAKLKAMARKGIIP